jgi:hypothetical protein
MSFWANKLGTTAPPAAPRQVINPNYVPRGMGSDTQTIQRAVNDYVSRLPGQTMAPPGTPPPLYQQQQYQADPLDPTGDFKMAVRNWQGGQGRKETETYGGCPACGSNNFFSRSTDLNGMPLRIAPAPECWECGYPRGQGVLAGAAAQQGPAQASRQGSNPGQAYGSQNELGPSVFSQK